MLVTQVEKHPCPKTVQGHNIAWLAGNNNGQAMSARKFPLPSPFLVNTSVFHGHRLPPYESELKSISIETLSKIRKKV